MTPRLPITITLSESTCYLKFMLFIYNSFAQMMVKSILCFIIFLVLMGTINYKMNTRVFHMTESNDRDHELIRKVFNWITDQMS